MHPLAIEFATLFEGHVGCYGTYTLTGEVKPSGKQIGKAATHNKPVLLEHYHDHLMGKCGLGITPINELSMARFGAIDIDEYPLDIELLNAKVQSYKLPVVVCRTKSGGVHLYLFTEKFVPAALMQEKLRAIASALGYGTCEIYPRQSQLLAERGDVGNWINLPYFEGDKTMRYGLDAKNKAMHLRGFIEYVQKRLISEVDLLNLKVTPEDTLPGGPPCLQLLVKQGFPEGTRNNGLMNLGVYAMKAGGDQWEKMLEDYNNRFMNPPLASEEVLGVMKSLRRKDYSYTCKSQPIQSYCNAAVCRTCKYGISGADLGMPKMGTLTKLTTVPPIWFMDVETEDGIKRMELTTEELQEPKQFQKRCMEALNTMPVILKRENWMSIVQKLLTELTVVEIPMEATPQGQFLSILESFCMSKVRARVADELMLGKPWHVGDEVHFRLQDLLQYLNIKKFTLLPLNRIAVILRETPGCHKHFHNLKGKGCNVMVLPVSMFSQQKESFDTPEQPKEVI